MTEGADIFSATKVAVKRFLDDVAVEIVETKLIAALADILLPASVFSMSDEVVQRIAGESEDSRRQRQQLKNQLEVLGKGADFCKRFVGVRLGGEVRLRTVHSLPPNSLFAHVLVFQRRPG